jgi:hypothetical protein
MVSMLAGLSPVWAQNSPAFDKRALPAAVTAYQRELAACAHESFPDASHKFACIVGAMDHLVTAVKLRDRSFLNVYERDMRQLGADADSHRISQKEIVKRFNAMTGRFGHDFVLAVSPKT